MNLFVVFSELKVRYFCGGNLVENGHVHRDEGASYGL